MTDLDLTAAIEAAARAMWDHTFEDGFWDSMTHDGENAQHCLLNAELALRAALPEIREQLARRIEAEAMSPGDAAALVRGGTALNHPGQPGWPTQPTKKEHTTHEHR